MLITDPTWIFFTMLSIILFAPMLLERLHIPSIVGMIFAGVLIGPHGFGVLERDGSFLLNLDGAEVKVEATDVEIFSEDIPGWLVANEGKLTVALEVTITEELRCEGVARELVNRIQNIRKSSGLEITDKIQIQLTKHPQSDAAVEAYRDYICKQVLGTSLTLVDELPEATELDMDDYKLYVKILKN